jgi:hypothetical protein
MERSPLKVGEVVAIAQPYKDVFSGEKNTHWFQEHPGWSNKMFVAAVNMPHHIKITKVGVEKLQDISEEDCLKEGVIERRIRPFNEIEIMYQVPLTTIYKENKKEAFAALIDKVSGKGTWEADPMVFVYSFELID